jgi:DNA polymerase V
MDEKIYLCIDLKSFFASVECAERGLDPFVTNLVVADPERTQGTVCLAITPAMKKLGIRNRCRMFEIPKDVEFITAKPRMHLYMEYSANIYAIYLKYVSAEDIHIYSIDECFLDVTHYLKLYHLSAKELAKKIIDDVFATTKICATVGIGTNLFLTKIALDITAKHARDFMGYLDEEEFRKTIWHHKPITDIWGIGSGIARRLEKFGIETLFDVAHTDEKLLYREFGVNAELLIDHANGKEPCTIEDIHRYKTKSNSLSNGQILFEDYSFADALMVMSEMVDNLELELVERHLVTNGISLTVGYSKDVISHTGGSMKLPEYTNSSKKLRQYFEDFFKKTTNKNYPIRKINIGFLNVVDDEFTSISFFTDAEEEEKEFNMQRAVLDIKEKYGKNSIVRGSSLKEKSTARRRNNMIGGHNG